MLGGMLFGFVFLLMFSCENRQLLKVEAIGFAVFMDGVDDLRYCGSLIETSEARYHARAMLRIGCLLSRVLVLREGRALGDIFVEVVLHSFLRAWCGAPYAVFLARSFDGACIRTAKVLDGKSMALSPQITSHVPIQTYWNKHSRLCILSIYL